MDPSKACSPDAVRWYQSSSAEVAKEMAHALILLFQTSPDTGIVPADWRTAKVAPSIQARRKVQTRKLLTYKEG